jgi:hypothetical protein
MFDDGVAPFVVLRDGLGQAGALQGHDADAVRSELYRQLAAQDVDRAQGDLNPPM